MDRLEKCKILKSKGFKYDPETGKIYGIKGNEIISKDKYGYIYISSRSFKSHLRGHHFAWYMTYDNVEFKMLDHINRNTSDNRIDNLRIVTNQQNSFNKVSKGYTWNKNLNKWQSQIKVNYKNIYLGLYETEEEAQQSYLLAKKQYHLI